MTFTLTLNLLEGSEFCLELLTSTGLSYPDSVIEKPAALLLGSAVTSFPNQSPKTCPKNRPTDHPANPWLPLACPWLSTATAITMATSGSPAFHIVGGLAGGGERSPPPPPLPIAARRPVGIPAHRL